MSELEHVQSGAGMKLTLAALDTIVDSPSPACRDVQRDFFRG
jgi:hypothetical protein